MLGLAGLTPGPSAGVIRLSSIVPLHTALACFEYRCICSLMRFRSHRNESRFQLQFRADTATRRKSRQTALQFPASDPKAAAINLLVTPLMA